MTNLAFAYTNPFLAAPVEVGIDSGFSYALVKSGPEVDPNEVELAHVQSAEVLVMWEQTVIHVAHLTPPRDFYLGEDSDPALACDVFLPARALGASRIPLLLVNGAELKLVIPAGASGSLTLADRSVLSLDAARIRAAPCALLAGATELPLAAGAKARLRLGDFVLQVAAVPAGKPTAHGLAAGFDRRALAFFSLSALVSASIIAVTAFFVPPLGLSDEDDLDRDRLTLMQTYLHSSAERETLERESAATDAATVNHEGGTGSRSPGAEGSMGNPTSHAQNARFAVRGQPDNPDPHLARERALREATTFGLIGILNAGLAGDPKAPTSPWGRDEALGRDAESARGNLFGATIDEAFGAGGLALLGHDEGGGGHGEGIGIGDVGTIGHGAGNGPGQGFGHDHGRLMQGHVTKSPRIVMGQTVVTGRLPPEIIQRVVRQNFGRFRMCYELGLGRNPNLEGRVTARFVIGRDGAVSNVANGGSDLPDAAVMGCVLSAFYGISFPAPENGIVAVSYPILLSPG